MKTLREEYLKASRKEKGSIQGPTLDRPKTQYKRMVESEQVYAEAKNRLKEVCGYPFQGPTLDRPKRGRKEEGD